MPPKVKITKEDIINTALTFVREKGSESLNARAIANALNCSTQPIFSNFATMQELNRELIYAAYQLYNGFLTSESEKGEFPKYKSYGMAYIRFAKEERELFKLLFMRNRRGEEASPTPDFTESVEMIMEANSISRKEAELMHLEMWSCVHGIAVMIATSFLSFDSELVSSMLSNVYMGIRTRHTAKE